MGLATTCTFGGVFVTMRIAILFVCLLALMGCQQGNISPTATVVQTAESTIVPPSATALPSATTVLATAELTPSATATANPPTSTPLATTIATEIVAPTSTPIVEFIQSSLGITLPSTVSIELFAAGLNYPTALAFDDEGYLYVGINNGIYPYQPVGEILRLRDSDGDGSADEITRYAADIDRPVGLLYHGGEVYLSQRGSVMALTDVDGDGVSDDSRILVTDLPAYGLHHNNSVILGPDGYLYFTLGSTTNNGPEPDPLNGTVLRVLPDGGEAEIFASGFRNPFDLAFDVEGNLFATDNGCDPPVCVDAPEEFNHVIEEGNYGFPAFAGTPPEGSDTVGPIATFAPHTSANGMIIYQDEMFPEWQGDAFVALFGSYLEGFRDVGHRVLRVEMTPTDEGFTATVYPFSDGFARPLDIAVAPDGSIFIADFEGGSIYRLFRE
jgi:putative membrane-bound dehydrogenase-like protein